MGTVDRQGSRFRGTDRGEPAVEDATVDLRQLQWLRFAALAEGATLLLLVCVAVPLKHLGDWPSGVRLLGPIHGFAFIVYLWLILQSFGAGLLSRGEAVRLAVAAFVPAAGFLTARFLTRRIAGTLNPGAGK